MAIKSTKTIKYGAQFDNPDPVVIEMSCIKAGGQWVINGKKCGEGLFFHYRALQSLLWPDEVHTRWTDLVLREILNNRVTCVIGPGSSWKTHTTAKYALTDYLCFPRGTGIIISSTDMKGLERRVWGDIKDLHRRAKEQRPWLPGNVVDYLHVICTDNIVEDGSRIMKDGIFCVPCVSSSGKFQGLGKYVGFKNDRVRMIADECFPKGTMVDTPSGMVPIEKIKPGDLVINAYGIGRVSGCMKKSSNELVKITSDDGREIICTGNHPFLTNQGWKNAIDLNQNSYMISGYESLQILRRGNQEQSFLQSELQREASVLNTGGKGQVLYERKGNENFPIKKEVAPRQSGKVRAGGGGHEKSFRIGKFGEGSENFTITQEVWAQADGSGREWDRPNQCGIGITSNDSGLNLEPSNKNRNEKGFWVSNMLQGGRGRARTETGDRSRRSITQSQFKNGSGPEENRFSSGAWVVSVEAYQQTDSGPIRNSEGQFTVHNLQVEGHPSYSVNGFIVHNCQFMAMSFLDAQSNYIHNPGYKFIPVGNPNPTSPENPLHFVADPVGGWASIPDDGKTKVWNCKFMQGRCVNLDGADSPNNDFPENGPVKYPKLTNRNTLKLLEETYGKESEQYYSQGRGIIKLGVAGRKVITRELCEQFHAMDPVIWMNTEQTKIGMLDAAYSGVGGDRCVLGWLEFGTCSDGHTRILMRPPILVPITVRTDLMAEDQIADFCRAEMERNGVEPKNFFFDGRGSLATRLAALWSPDVNAVEFGGKPTARPVSNDIFVNEPNGMRRLKRADEHYSKFVSELWWSARYAIESDQIRGLTLDIILDGTPREWKKVAGDRIEVEPKKDMKKRTFKSPDLFDMFVAGIEGARRRGFQIKRIGDNAGTDRTKLLDDLEKMQQEYDDMLGEHLLVHA